MKVGYTNPLFILPFDHRSSFVKKMYGVSGNDITDQIREQVKDLKKVIYEAFEAVVPSTIPKDQAAILVDEEYGEELLLEAREKGFQILLPIERSGQEEFDFEYGDNFDKHIEDVDPAFVKALVRYNPAQEARFKTRQLEKLKLASDYCHNHNRRFLIEALVEPTSEQLEKAGGDKRVYDQTQRPALATELIREFQEAGVEADVWKMEGMEKTEDYEHMVAQARNGGRENVGIVVLGRGETREFVDKWIIAGAKVNGVIGFAVGRTIFWDALVEFKEGRVDRQEAVKRIADNYIYYYNLFNNA